MGICALRDVPGKSVYALAGCALSGLVHVPVQSAGPGSRCSGILGASSRDEPCAGGDLPGEPARGRRESAWDSHAVVVASKHGKSHFHRATPTLNTFLAILDTLLSYVLYEPLHFFMERKMLQGITQRAEQASRKSDPYRLLSRNYM